MELPAIIGQSLALLNQFKQDLLDNRNNYYYSPPANPAWSIAQKTWMANHFQLNLQDVFEEGVTNIIIGACSHQLNGFGLITLNTAISNGWLSNIESIRAEIRDIKGDITNLGGRMDRMDENLTNLGGRMSRIEVALNTILERLQDPQPQDPQPANQIVTRGRVVRDR